MCEIYTYELVVNEVHCLLSFQFIISYFSLFMYWSEFFFSLSSCAYDSVSSRKNVIIADRFISETEVLYWRHARLLVKWTAFFDASQLNLQMIVCLCLKHEV